MLTLKSCGIDHEPFSYFIGAIIPHKVVKTEVVLIPIDLPFEFKFASPNKLFILASNRRNLVKDYILYCLNTKISSFTATFYV